MQDAYDRRVEIRVEFKWGLGTKVQNSTFRQSESVAARKRLRRRWPRINHSRPRQTNQPFAVMRLAIIWFHAIGRKEQINAVQPGRVRMPPQHSLTPRQSCLSQK